MPTQHVTTYKRSTGGAVASSGSPTNLTNFQTGNSGTVILDDQNDSVTLGPFTRDDDNPSSTDVYFGDQMPNNATVHGIEVRVGAVHLSSGTFTNSEAFVSKFQVLNTNEAGAAGTVEALSNVWAQSGTETIYDGQDHLSHFISGGTITDPASYNFTFGGANNLLGLSSLEYNKYNNLGLKITFSDESATPGADSRIAARLFSHSNGVSPAIRLHYSLPRIGNIHILNTSKISITGTSKISIT